MNGIEIKNAVIESVSINDGERGLLTAYLYLTYGKSGAQGFGGHALYLPKSYSHHKIDLGFAGHFIFRCMQIGGVSRWEDLNGKTIRVKAEHSKVHAIGHIVNDDWFEPAIDFKPNE